MAKKSIASRWFVNSFSVIVAVLLCIDVVVFFVVSNYYYDAVDQSLESEANIVSGVLVRFYDDNATDYRDEIRTAIEGFDKKDMMELMAISGGKVVLSSSGFSPSDNYDMPDYNTALTSENGVGKYVGNLSSGEKYMAVTVVINSNSSAYEAVRVVASLEKIDIQIYSITLFIGFVSVLIVLALFALGLYFIKSIVQPIRQIGATAKKLAIGDFSVRIIPKSDDELGELCNVFNYMADELENAETIKNDFISSVSHELRTPLTAIKGWSETMLEMQDPETNEKGLKVISQETERLSEMVEELLDFSRIQNGRLVLQKANIDILAELADAVLVYGEKARHDGIHLIYNEPDNVAMIYGDKNRLRQVFINIIDNAVKYSKNDGTVMIEAVTDESEIIISVSDMGCGISEEDLPKIKKRFYKANNTVRGSGIGLAVADEIVTMHEGSLTISSQLGVGTVVTITLPIIKKKNEPDERNDNIE